MSIRRVSGIMNSENTGRGNAAKLFLHAPERRTLVIVHTLRLRY